MSRNYAELEEHVIKLFEMEKKFKIEGNIYELKKVGKPRPSQGECKTDVYVLGEDTQGNLKELKISVKREGSNEFQGNKFKPEDAENLLGSNWKEIITKATSNIAEKFKESKLMYIDNKGRVKANSVTMGWKLEVASRPRNLSAPLPLETIEIRNLVYKGVDQANNRKDSLVNGELIINSGIADYILYSEKESLNSVEDIVIQMEKIDALPLETESTYLIFTANNWRTEEDKTDGGRYLAVYVEWELVNNKLEPKFIYDSPLSIRGSDNKVHLKDLFDQLGINHPSDLNIDEHINSKYVYKR